MSLAPTGTDRIQVLMERRTLSSSYEREKPSHPAVASLSWHSKEPGKNGTKTMTIIPFMLSDTFLSIHGKAAL